MHGNEEEMKINDLQSGTGGGNEDEYRRTEAVYLKWKYV